MAAQGDDIFKQLLASLLPEGKLDLALVVNISLIHEDLNRVEYFHGDGEGLSGIFLLVGMGEVLKLSIELVKEVGMGGGLQGEYKGEDEQCFENECHLCINYEEIND